MRCERPTDLHPPLDANGFPDYPLRIVTLLPRSTRAQGYDSRTNISRLLGPFCSLSESDDCDCFATCAYLLHPLMVRMQGRPFDILVPRGALRALGIPGTAGVKRPRTGRRRKRDDANFLIDYKLVYLDLYLLHGVIPTLGDFAAALDLSLDTLHRYRQRLHLPYPPL